MANYINSTKAPALVLAPNVYSQSHFDILNGQLRIYFNAVDSANSLTIQEDNKLNAFVWLNAGTGIF